MRLTVIDRELSSDCQKRKPDSFGKIIVAFADVLKYSFLETT